MREATISMGVVLAACAAVATGCGKDEAGGDKTGAGQKKAATTDSVQKQVDDEIKKAVPESKAGKEFGVERVKIVFEHNGMEKGVETVWVDGYGETVILDRKMTEPGPSNMTFVWTGGKQYSWNRDTDEVRKMPIRVKGTELRMGLSEKQMEMAGYVKKPAEEVAGKTAEVWHTDKQNVTLWRWKGIDIKSDNRALKSTPMAYHATSIEEGVAPPADILAKIKEAK